MQENQNNQNQEIEVDENHLIQIRKDKLKELSNDEKLELLASDGMLVKRPLAVSGEKVTLGFNEEQYKDVWL